MARVGSPQQRPGAARDEDALERVVEAEGVGVERPHGAPQRRQAVGGRIVGVAGGERARDPLLERRRDTELLRREVAHGQVEHRPAALA